MTLTIVRGLPGSGKSTVAKALAKVTGATHLESDMYFMVAGIYKFDPFKLPLAHKWCQDEAKKRLAKGYSIVVSNTFTMKWEMQPYFDMAEELGVKVQVIEVHGNFGSVHSVPADVLAKMKARWEAYND